MQPEQIVLTRPAALQKKPGPVPDRAMAFHERNLSSQETAGSLFS
jgi:hypothetical protein